MRHHFSETVLGTLPDFSLKEGKFSRLFDSLVPLDLRPQPM
jgi:hypothetical protein